MGLLAPSRQAATDGETRVFVRYIAVVLVMADVRTDAGEGWVNSSRSGQCSRRALGVGSDRRTRII
jgi:hypothetical protein